MEVEWQFEKHVLFTGDAILVDESFDHELGTEKREAVEINDFKIIVYINGFDRDLTNGFSDDDRAMYKKWFTDFVADRYTDVLRAARDNNDEPPGAA